MSEGELDGHKVAAARLWATNRYPYLASAVFAAKTMPAPGIGRMMIDRWWRIHADPEVIAAATVEELGGELLHLTSHVLRDHATRADAQHFSEEAELHHWVDAADAEVADDFPAEQARVSETVRPQDLDLADGKLAEEYYRQGSIRAHQQQEHDQREPEHWDCGSGAHGDSPQWEPPPPNSSSEGVSEDEQQLIRRNVAAEVARSDAETVSASLRRWAEDRLVPTIDWRAELAAALRRTIASVSGAVDYSYHRPSRRASAVSGVILPSLHRPEVEVAVVCDTSASISEELLGSAMAEVDGLLRATGTRSVRVLSCDDAVRTVNRVTSARDVRLIGGGGTDMAIGIDAAMDHRPQPQLLVVLTDGNTPWPDEPPRASVVVALLDDAGDGGGAAVPPNVPPAWARTITVSS